MKYTRFYVMRYENYKRGEN